MKLLQALFFPPEQPGGVSSMIPYLQERFTSPRWEMELFSIPKRIRNKGRDEVTFDTFDWTRYEQYPIVQKYIQTYRDYLWWTRLRIQKPYDLIHAHHPIAGIAMKTVFPDIPLVQTIHSSYEKELILNGKIEENGPEHQFLVSLYGEMEQKADRLIAVSHSFQHYLTPYVQNPQDIAVIPNGYDEKRFKPIPHENEVTQLITVCRLVPAKGLDILLRACAELKKEIWNLCFILLETVRFALSWKRWHDSSIYTMRRFFMDIPFIQKSLCLSLMYLFCLLGRRPLVRYLRKQR